MEPEKKVWHPIQYHKAVRGLEVAVFEEEDRFGTVEVSILGTINGQHIIAQIDKSDPGAVARALSLAELVQAAIEAVEESWFEIESTQ